MTDKKQKPPEKPPEKQYYIVDVEGMMPVKVRFRVHAFDEDDAYKVFDTRPDQCTPLHQPQPQPGKIQPKKVTIRHHMSALAKWMRRF